MKICVLGHQGMLGHVVFRFLKERGHQMVTVSSKFTNNTCTLFIDELISHSSDWTINCIGRRTSECTAQEELFYANAFLVKTCLSHLEKPQNFIQASTDGVFNPHTSDRSVNDILDAQDFYGQSKIEAEKISLEYGAKIIRTSIIGPDLCGIKNIFSWYLSQSNPVRGYANHSWNGITSLEWAKICERIITEKQAGSILQPAITPAISKKDLLEMIRRDWPNAVPVISGNAPNNIKRTLIPNINCPPLLEQLRGLKKWYFQ
jgi:dTDP-4-dehydrorhamnose reductase